MSRRLPVCGSRTKQRPGTCKRPAGWGTDHVGVGHCRTHGGNTPSHRKAAQLAGAEAAMVTYGRPVDTNPIDALLEELRWTFGHVIWLRDQVQALDPGALIWGMSKRKAEGSMALEILAGGDIEAIPTVGVEVTEIAGATVWVRLYQDERKHLVEVAATCARLGIDERKVRLAEQQGALLVAGLQWFVAKLGLSVRKAELANRLALEMFRFLDTGQVPPIEGSTT